MTSISRRRSDQLKPYVESEVVDGMKLCPESVKEHVRTIVNDWTPKLFLNAYSVGIAYRGADEERHGGHIAASCNVGHPYLHVGLTLFPEFWEWNSPLEQEQIIVHELSHVLTEDLYALVTCVQGGDVVTAADLNDTREWSTDLISTALWCLRDNLRDAENRALAIDRRRVEELEHLTGIYPRLFVLFGFGAREWLESSHPQLGGEKAVDLLGTPRMAEVLAIVAGLETGALA